MDFYCKRMVSAYVKVVQNRDFNPKNMVLKIVNSVKKNLAPPTKFTPQWEGPYIIKETHGNRYYYLTSIDGQDLQDLINEKRLKRYYY